MHSIYIGQLVRPVAAPLLVHMHVCLGDVAYGLQLSAPCMGVGAYFKWKMIYCFMKRFLLPYIMLEHIVFDFF